MGKIPYNNRPFISGDLMKRETWGSRIGFILAVAGSAIGLANIWRFPYMVGQNGGAAFIAIYLLCLLLIGFPVFLSEILIGKKAHANPARAMEKVGHSKVWRKIGLMTIITGFLVSSFYSAVAGWVLGYLVEAVRGTLTFESPTDATNHFNYLISHPSWGLVFHLLFMTGCLGVLYLGVKAGIERANKIMMPCLFVILIFIVVKGLLLPNSAVAINYLLQPDWTLITPAAWLAALGHSFFTLSLGQGTMITYGSYLKQNEPVLKSLVPVVIMDTVVSLLATFAIFTIAFSQGVEPGQGPGLLFSTLPFVFNAIPGGLILASLFFLLVVLAALTSEISAMEPAIAYLIEEKRFTRHQATAAVGAGAFILGVPSALSGSLLSGIGFNFLEFMDLICNSILIPIGGFAAVILLGYRWGFKNAYHFLMEEQDKPGLLKGYLWFGIKISAPILVIFVFLNALGIL